MEDGVEPARPVPAVLGIHREALHQLPAGGVGLAFEIREVRPRRFGVHMVGSDRGDPAPVVDSRVDEGAEGAGLQIGRRLHAHARTEDQARHRDAPAVLVEGRLGGLGHQGARLGPEVLNDDLLDMVVLFVHGANCEQRLDPFTPRLADADEDAGGEGHRRLACRAQGLDASLRPLVGRAEVGATLLAEALGEGLHHDPRRDRHAAEALEIARAHQPGVQVGQESGALEHQPGHRLQVGEGGVAAEVGECVAGGAIAVLGAVAQGEQGFLAPRLGTLLRDLQHLLREEIGCIEPARGLREGAVVAHVAAEPGEGDEHLARIAHPAGMGEVPRAPCGGAQAFEWSPFGEGEEAVIREPLSLGCARERVLGAVGHVRPRPRSHKDPGLRQNRLPRPEWGSTISARKGIA